MSNLKPLGQGMIPRILSRLYLFMVAIRNAWYDYIPGSVKNAGRYTISVGCIHAGGTGKTPLTLLIGKNLCTRGKEVAILSRGYKRKTKKNILIKPFGAVQGWEQIGDEPAMMQKELAGAWFGIGANRYQSAKALVPFLKKESVFILDDGFQHRKISRNIDIVCLPPNPFNDFCIPSGYMREQITSLKRADMLCLIGLKKEAPVMMENVEILKKTFPSKPIAMMFQVVDTWVNARTGEKSSPPPFKKPLLLSGIARPDRFIELVKESGITPVNTAIFGDHHAFNAHEIESNCTSEIDGIITTEKDIIRLSAINLVNCPNICYLIIKLEFTDGATEELFYKYLYANKTSLS